MRPHASAAFAVLLAVAPCAAGLIERDLFEPGDGLLTYDEATGREWLDFTIGRYLAASGITDSGDLRRVLNDFQIATLDDVEALMRSAATPRVDPWSFAFVANSGVDLVDLMGETMQAPGSITGNRFHAGGLVAPGSGVGSGDESLVAVAAFNFRLPYIPGLLSNQAASRNSGYYVLTDSEYPFDFDPDWRASLMAAALVSDLDRETNTDLDTGSPIVVDDLQGNGYSYYVIFPDLDGDGVIDDDEIIVTYIGYLGLYQPDVSVSPLEGGPAYWLYREAAPVPEPSAVVLALMGFAALSLRKRESAPPTLTGTAATAAVLLFAANSGAGLIERDLFEPGDGLLTYDEATGREWLDFSVSSELLREAGSTDLRLPARLNDFRVATLADVETLLESAEVERFEAWSLPLGSAEGAERLTELMGATLTLPGNLFAKSVYTGGLVAESRGPGTHPNATAAVLVQTFGDGSAPPMPYPTIRARAQGGYYRLRAGEYPLADGPISQPQRGATNGSSPPTNSLFDRFFLGELIDFSALDTNNDGIISDAELAATDSPPTVGSNDYTRIGATPLSPTTKTKSEFQKAVNELFLAGVSGDQIAEILEVTLSETETVTLTVEIGDDPGSGLTFEAPAVVDFNQPPGLLDTLAPGFSGVVVDYRVPRELLESFYDYATGGFPQQGVVQGPKYDVISFGDAQPDDRLVGETPRIDGDLTDRADTVSALVIDLDGDGDVENGEIIGILTNVGDASQLSLLQDRIDGAPAYWLYREAAPVPEPAGFVLAAAAGIPLVRRWAVGRQA